MGCRFFQRTWLWDRFAERLHRRQQEQRKKSIYLQSKEEAQNDPTLVTTYALFYDREYLTNEQMNDKRFLKILQG